jgi:hypothetical protein
MLQRSRDVDKEEIAASTRGACYVIASGFAGIVVGSNRGSDDSSARSGKFGSNKCDSLNVLVSVFGGKPEFCLSCQCVFIKQHASLLT